MMVSPFTFYRGAAKIMAADLADTPTAGLDVQLCGDAHLSNFGVFASPERTLLFDLNDFDETLPGPFEYDVKRMAASFVIGGRNKEPAADARSGQRQRRRLPEGDGRFAEMGTMDTCAFRPTRHPVGRRANAKRRARQAGGAGRQDPGEARTRDSLQALSNSPRRSAGSVASSAIRPCRP
jgi:hypothetical protein